MSATATFIDCCTVAVAAAPRRSCTLIRSWARQLTRTPPDAGSGSRQTPPAGAPARVVQRQPGLDQRGGDLHDQRGQRVGVGQQRRPTRAGSRSSWSPSSPSHARSSGEGRGATPPSARRMPWTETAGSPPDRAAQSASIRSANGPATHLRRRRRPATSRVRRWPPPGRGGRRRRPPGAAPARRWPGGRAGARDGCRRGGCRAVRARALPLAGAVALELVAGRRAGAQGDHDAGQHDEAEHRHRRPPQRRAHGHAWTPQHPLPRRGSAADKPKGMAAAAAWSDGSGHAPDRPVTGSLRGASIAVGDPPPGAPPCRHAARSPAETR